MFVVPIALVATGCGSHGVKNVPPVPKSEILAKLPPPWNEAPQKPPIADNGYERFAAALTVNQSAVPKLPDGARDMTVAQKAELSKRFAPWIAELEKCLAMDHWAAPVPESGIDTRFPELALMKRVQQGIFVTAEVAVANGDTERAVRLMLLADRFGDAQVQAGGAVLHLLVGLALDAISNRAISEGLVKGRFSESQLHELLTAAGKADLALVFRTAALDEFHGISVVELARSRFPETVEHFRADGFAERDLPPKWEQSMDDLFGGHDDPFDRVQTARIIANGYQAVIDGLGKGYADASKAHREFLRAIEPWAIDDVDEFFSIGKASPETRAEWRKRAQSTANPYGKLFAALISPNNERLSDALFSYTTRGETLRAVIGIRLFELRFKRLPQSLDELVQVGILKQTPADPFADKALRYDPKRRLVWSVGRNGTDDGGNGEPYKVEPDFIVPF